MTINIRGKEYVTVSERVAAAHEDNAEFEILNHEIVTIGETGRWWFMSTIRVHGRLYTGTAEIKFDAPKNSPDGMNPVECAETSAVGRALGFAGYGVVDGIATGDEIARSEPRQPVRKAPATVDGGPVIAPNKEVKPARLKGSTPLWGALRVRAGYVDITAPTMWAEYCKVITGKDDPNTYTLADYDAVKADIERMEREQTTGRKA